MTTWVCERCSTVLAVGLSRCPHCGAPPGLVHEFGSRPEDDEHPMMGRVVNMAKIGRATGPTDKTVVAPEDAVTEEPPEDESEPAGSMDDPEAPWAPPQDLVRPSTRAARTEWVEWAAAAGYHGPCVDVLTVPQIQALPDGPPDYDDDGLLRTPDGASEETAQAIGSYNVKAIDLYPSSAGPVDAPAVEAEPEDAEPEDEPEEA